MRMKILLYIVSFLVIVSCSPKNTNNDIYYNLAWDEEQKGNMKQAIAYLDTAIDIDPNDVEALNNRAYDYMELKQYKKAKDDFLKIIAIDSVKAPGAYYGLGFLNYTEQDYQLAIRYFNKALQ